MPKKSMSIARICLFLMLFHMGQSRAECNVPINGLVVLLKLDDVTDEVDAKKNAVFAAHWARVTDFLESNNIASSYGIIGSSLEDPSPAYLDWFASRRNKNVIEFWNHGYTNHFAANKAIGEITEFNGTTAERQAYSISRTQLLAKQKLGITLNGFGPHASFVDKNTFDQIDANPELKFVWFFKPVDDKKHPQTIIQRTLELENPIFHPNFESFSKTFAHRDMSVNYVALQGHPWSWDDNGFNGFVRIVTFLRDQHAVFCRPSEYLATLR